MKNRLENICPICHKSSYMESTCECGYEFGGNRCTNPDCRRICKDTESFCPECGCETVNYMEGYIGD